MKKPSKADDTLLLKKVKLFLLQSMKVDREKLDEEANTLLAFHEANGYRALLTRLRIFYGGDFEEIDALKEDELDRYLSDRKGFSPLPTRRNKGRRKSESFSNIYNELAFYRKPDVKFRFNKV